MSTAVARPRAAAAANARVRAWLYAGGALAAFATVAAITRVSSWGKPLQFDTGAYLYMGETLLDGGTIYADSVDNKMPLTYVLFAGIRGLAGTSADGVRLVLLAFTAIAALALAAYVARFAGRAAGVLAGLTFAALAAVPAFEGDDPNTEQFGVAPMLAAWWMATKPGRGWAMGAGALAATAVLMNLSFAVAVPFVAFELWRQADRGGRTRRLLDGAIGGALVAIPVFAWLGVAGALDDLRLFVFGYVEGAVDPGDFSADDRPFGSRKPGPGGPFDVPAGGLWLLGLAGCVLAARDARLRRVALPVAAWIVAGWLRVKLANYSYTHHYFPVLPGLAAGMALGIASVWRGSRTTRALVAGAVLIAPVWGAAIRPQIDLLDTPARERWGLGTTGGAPNHVYALAYPVADFIRSHTTPEETIFVTGGSSSPTGSASGSPQTYWLAERRAPTRFFYTYYEPRRRAFLTERSRALRRNPPRAIAAMPWVHPDPDTRSLLRELHYRQAFFLNGARVWLRPE